MTRIDRLLARNLGCSRKESNKLLRAGRVCKEEGEVLRDPKQRIADAELPLAVTIDGEATLLRQSFHLLQHKPCGVVTARKDGLHPTAYSLLSEQPLFPELLAVGRLDLDTSGLLLWTTDGGWVHRLTHPKQRIIRRYQAALSRPWRPIEAPYSIRLDDDYEPQISNIQGIGREQCHPALAIPDSAVTFAEISLTSGKFHEVKRIFAALDSEVVSLARVAHGPFELPADLGPGEVIEIDFSDHLQDP